MTRIEYEKSICQRLAEATQVSHRKVLFADGSLPVQSVCHQNVDRFIKENSGYKVVRGWVTYADFGLSVGLTAHSVIQDRDGQLIDITPLGNERDRPGMRFVRHIGTEQEFRSMRDCGISIECPIGR